MKIKESADRCGKRFVEQRSENLGDHKDILWIINKIKKIVILYNSSFLSYKQHFSFV
jgi:hypothetical protein